MAFHSVNQLLERFKQLGATRVFCKRVRENDNVKQGIYLGRGFDVLGFFPFEAVRDVPGPSYVNLHATLNLYWVSESSAEHASVAKLILYSKYPEVRLSGFTQGCITSPNDSLQPVSQGQRTGQHRGVLVFGTTPDRRTLAYFVAKGSSLSRDLDSRLAKEPQDGVFFEIARVTGSSANRALLLEKLRQLHAADFHPSMRMTGAGEMVPYVARNAGGTTLEALLGIRPNSLSAPDYLGWEIKGYGSDKITLMTPEPNGGYYGENGVVAFVRKYGYASSVDRLDFTGLHKLGSENQKTHLTLTLNGFNAETNEIEDVSGAVALLDAKGSVAASWNIAKLLEHWNRKHAFAAYVPYTHRNTPSAYRYDSPVLLGEGTNFPKFLAALCSQHVAYDPGCKVEGLSTGKITQKARSQFRISLRRLNVLYDRIEPVDL